MRNRYQAIARVIQNFIKWLPSVICSVIALFEVANGNLTVGELMAFIVLFSKISTPMSELPFMINDGREMFISASRVNEIIRADKEPSGTYTGNVLPEKEDVISLENICYWYDSNPERKILDQLNLKFEKGKTTAIVGTSGAGKTTLFKLLCGFERPKSGTYRLYGTDFNGWELKQARSKIALV
jgi:ABC-type bacteriocin/lantibiotic exporter with double-glycine peptidase domain